VDVRHHRVVIEDDDRLWPLLVKVLLLIALALLIATELYLCTMT
jgi:hypothetical protein